jgi:hypothetical protein
MGMNAAITNTQIASSRPKIRIFPSAFVEENMMKYPSTNQIVAGRKLKKKHMTLTSLCEPTSPEI